MNAVNELGLLPSGGRTGMARPMDIAGLGQQVPLEWLTRQDALVASRHASAEIG